MRKNIYENILLLIFVSLACIILFSIFINLYISKKSEGDYIKILEDYPFELINESKIREYNEGSIILETLKPNSSMNLSGAYVKINSLGFRDYEYSLKKPEDKFRIAVLGDSFTFGYGISLNETYVKQLEKELNKIEETYEVLNFGGNGANTFLESIYLNSTVKKFEPDLVIIGFFPNDADHDYISDEEYCLKNKKDFKEMNNFLDYSEYEKYSYKLLEIKKKKEILNFKKLNPIDKYYINIYQEDYSGYLCFIEGVKKLKQISKNENLEIIFVIIPDSSLNKEIAVLINSKVEFIINYYDLPTYNLLNYFENVDSKEIYTKIGPPHYNYLGNKIIAESILNILINGNYIK